MEDHGLVVDPTYVVHDAADVARGEVAGYNFKRTGRYVELFPRMSKADYATLQDVRCPADEAEMDKLLLGFTGIPASVRDAIRSSRKLVWVRDGVPVLVPRVPDALDEVDMDPPGVPEVAGEGDSPRPVPAKKRRYTLMQIFSDTSVLDKYRLSTRQVQTAIRLAASDAVQAASMLQDAMNACQSDVAVTVQAGDYAQSKGQAKLTIRSVCKSYNLHTAVVQSVVIGAELFLFGPNGEDDWHVRGPLEHAYAVHDVYRMVAARGTDDIHLLLGMELVLLSINILSVDHSYEVPDIQYHVGRASFDKDASPVPESVSAFMTSATRTELAGMVDRLLPVVDTNDVQIATAIRVSDRHVLVNTHVIESVSQCSVQGKVFQPQRQLARDVWAGIMPGEAQSWRMRGPVVGEQAAIAYRSGDQICVSSPVQIVSADGVIIVTTKASEVVSGTSGGALISLSDLALLGIHSAETNRNLVSYAFGAAQFSELIDGDCVSAVSRTSDDDSFGANAFKSFKKRGLGHVVTTIISSVVPVFSGSAHVGMAANVGGQLYTTCDTDLPLRFGNTKMPLVMNTVEGRLAAADNPFLGLKTPSFKRVPNYFEKVFVVGFDAEDTYFSAETMVGHISANARVFTLHDIEGVDKPLLGGLVVGWDGAVLGQCGVRSATTPVGVGLTCFGLPDGQPVAVTDPVVVLSAKFPFLNVAAWGPELLEEVFVHTSLGKYKSGRIFNAGCRPLANVGDNVAKAYLYMRLREKMVPHSQWTSHMQARQSNAAFAKLAWDFGYAECIRLGPGADLPHDSRAYADLTEALVGAAYLVETRLVFDQLCDAMGLGPVPDGAGLGS